MPFDIVLPVLGTCFVTTWIFIGGMLVRDSLDQARKVRFDTPSDRTHRHRI